MVKNGGGIIFRATIACDRNHKLLVFVGVDINDLPKGDHSYYTQ
jgi:hypothetical protein